MEVTEVRKVRKTWYITVGSERYRLPDAVYRERPLSPGEDVDPDEFDQWLLLRQYRPALEYAVSLLAQRPFAEKELEARMRRIGYRPATCEMVLYKLRINGLMDDAEFAKQFVQARANRNLGSGRILRELRQKGVDPDTAAEAMETISEDNQAAAAATMARKGIRSAKPGEDRRKTDQRVLAMLARRGFPYPVAREAIRAARRDAYNDDPEEELFDD